MRHRFAGRGRLKLKKLTSQGDLVNVNTVEIQFFEVLVVLRAGHSFVELDNLDDSLSKETTNFNASRVNFDFDREMLLDDVHFISESSGNTLEHIFDMCSYSVKNGGLLVGGHVSADLKESDGLVGGRVHFLTFVDFHFKMLEGLGDSASLSFNTDNSGLD